MDGRRFSWFYSVLTPDRESERGSQTLSVLSVTLPRPSVLQDSEVAVGSP